MPVLPFQFFDSYSRMVFNRNEEFVLGGNCPDRDPSLIPPPETLAGGAFWDGKGFVQGGGPTDLFHEIMLSNVLPDKANARFGCEITEIAIGNGYVGRNTLREPPVIPGPAGEDHTPAISCEVAFTNAAPSIGFMEGTSVKLTASGGNIADWRWIILYISSFDNPTHQKDGPLVGFWDHGSPVILTDGQTHEFRFDGALVGAVGNILKVTASPDPI